MTTAKTQAKPYIYPFIYEATMQAPKDASKMGLHEFDLGMTHYLDAGNYQRLQGGPAPLETFVSDESPNRFLIVGIYDGYFNNVWLVIQMPSWRDYKSFMEKYAYLAAVLPEELIKKPVEPPNNSITERKRAFVL